MKPVLLLVFVAFSYGAKLDKTYLPPATAQSAGGTGLETPKTAPGLVNEITGQYNSGIGWNNAGTGWDNAGTGWNNAGSGWDNAGTGWNNAGSGWDNTRIGLNNAGIGWSDAGAGWSNAGIGLSNEGAGWSNAGIGQYNLGGINGQFGGYTESFQQPISNFDNYNSLAANFRPERPQAVFERNAAILRYDNVNNGDNYAYRYETSNGIAAEESGIATNGVVAQGGFSYLGDDGRQYIVRYTADENGFRPVGDHLPTPPPIPEAILRSLEKNARDEAAGIYDDGSYNENLYGEKRGYNRGYNYPAANAANLQTFKNLEQANIQAQAINLLEQAKQAQAINNAVQANIQAQAISQLEQAKAQAVNHAAQTQAVNHAAQANIQAQAIKHAAQANIHAQAINNAAQANIQAQAINHAAQANIQAQAINHAAQAIIQAQAINHAAQANIQAQAIHQIEAKAQAINSLGQAKSTAGSRAYLPPKEH